MEILYIVSVIILLLSFILRKKSDKEIDIVGFVCTSIVLLFCYNTFICYVLTFLVIPIKLWILALINIAFSLILLIPIIKNKEIQKYTLTKMDLIYVSIIVIVILIIAYLNFGFPFDVNYISADPSHHYLTSIKFAKEDTLMHNAKIDKVYGDLGVRKPASYVNSGLLMKCLCEENNLIDYYHVFCGFGIFTLTLIGTTLFSALKKYAKKKEHTFWACIIALIFTLGYPLNSLLFGFEYLTLGLLIICAIIDAVYYYENNILKTSFLILILGLLNFGLFCSYYMFVPFVYPALWMYLCIKNYYKTKKIITKELITLLVVTLLIPFILGYIYHLAPDIYNILIDKSADMSDVMGYSDHILNSGLAVDGDIYVNIYSNIILLLPLTVYLFERKAKDKELKNEMFLGFIVLFAILFIEILLVGNGLGKVSLYYMAKNYFALWIILAFTNYKALVEISERGSENLSRIYIYVYTISLILYLILFNTKTTIKLNNVGNEISVMEIFKVNKAIILEKESDYNQKELEIMQYAKNNLDFDKRIEVVADHRTYYWSYVLLEYVNIQEEHKGQILLSNKWDKLARDGLDKENLDYIIYFNRSWLYKRVKSNLFENSQIIYENESGGILKIR